MKQNMFQDKVLRESKLEKNKSKKAFLTGVNIIKDNALQNIRIEPLKSEARKEHDYISEQKQRINEMLKNMEDIEDFTKDVQLSSNSKKKSEESNFSYVDLMKRIDSSKESIKSEFDELTYLVGYVKRTSKNIDRHIEGVQSLMKQAGIKPSQYTEEDNIDYQEYDQVPSNVDYSQYKRIELDKVKDKLLSITGSVINFHSDLRSNIKDSKSRRIVKK